VLVNRLRLYVYHNTVSEADYIPKTP